MPSDIISFPSPLAFVILGILISSHAHATLSFGLSTRLLACFRNPEKSTRPARPRKAAISLPTVSTIAAAAAAAEEAAEEEVSIIFWGNLLSAVEYPPDILSFLFVVTVPGGGGGGGGSGGGDGKHRSVVILFNLNLSVFDLLHVG